MLRGDLQSHLMYFLYTWIQDSSWPIFCHFLSILLAGLCISRAVSSIEFVNKIIIPILLAIIVLSFYWALSLKYAEYGIKYLFTPDWGEHWYHGLFLKAVTQCIMMRNAICNRIARAFPAAFTIKYCANWPSSLMTNGKLFMWRDTTSQYTRPTQ